LASGATLELPSFKGAPGWEFTPLEGLELAAFPPAPGRTEVVAAPDGVVVVPLREADHELLGTIVTTETALTLLNREHWSDGVLVHVPRGVHVAEPIRIATHHVQADSALHFRLLVVVEEGAQADIWHDLRSVQGQAALANGVVEISVGEGARLRFVDTQDLDERAWVFGAQRATVAQDATLDWITLGFGSGNGKVFQETQLAGRGAHGTVTGAYASRGRQHIDFDTLQEHAAPDTTSDLAFRGILADRSSAVWRGMIKVDPGAQRTDAFQESRNLLLSKRAHADAIPGLEILANDVRCTHAAAIAQIDPEQLFYLRSHGLPASAAKRLVIEGFLAALVERFEAGRVRDDIAAALDERLERVLGVP
jgi:Fe-S cluster assembly protein SufD